MNLTKRPVAPKGQRLRKSPNRPTEDQIRYRERVRALGCLIAEGCRGRTTIHHLFTGRGGRKDHDRIARLCVFHHTGSEGVNGGRLGRRVWEQKYVSEEWLEARVRELLG